MKNSTAPLEKSLAVSYNAKHSLPYDLAITLLDSDLTDMKIDVHTKVYM